MITRDIDVIGSIGSFNIKVQWESIRESYQDDGFGNCIDTADVCDISTNDFVTSMLINSWWNETPNSFTTRDIKACLASCKYITN